MYMINQRTVFQDGFTIGAHNLPVPASGYRLTMTVNGVETEIAPGEYHGEVVLEPRKPTQNRRVSNGGCRRL